MLNTQDQIFRFSKQGAQLSVLMDFYCGFKQKVQTQWRDDSADGNIASFSRLDYGRWGYHKYRHTSSSIAAFWVHIIQSEHSQRQASLTIYCSLCNCMIMTNTDIWLASKFSSIIYFRPIIQWSWWKKTAGYKYGDVQLWHQNVCLHFCWSYDEK